VEKIEAFYTTDPAKHRRKNQGVSSSVPPLTLAEPPLSGVGRDALNATRELKAGRKIERSDQKRKTEERRYCSGRAAGEKEKKRAL